MTEYVFLFSSPSPLLLLNIHIQTYYLLFAITKDRTLFSQGSDVSNFIRSDQNVVPYHFVVFLGNDAKSDFLLSRTGTIIPTESMDTASFGKTSLLVE